MMFAIGIHVGVEMASTMLVHHQKGVCGPE